MDLTAAFEAIRLSIVDHERRLAALEAKGTPVPTTEPLPIDLGECASLRGYRLWTPDSEWRRLARAEVDASSTQWMKSLRGDGAYVALGGVMAAPSVQANWGSQDPFWGIPYTVADNSTPLVPIKYDLGTYPELPNREVYADAFSPCEFRIPLPPYIQETRYPNRTEYIVGGDKHLLVINRDTGQLLELWNTYFLNGEIHAGAGVVWDIRKGDGQVPYGTATANAAGLPYFGGLLRYDEVESGEISHALSFTALYAWGRAAMTGVARNHQWNNSNCLELPPFGARIVLKPDFDENFFEHDGRQPYGPQSKVILRALKKYGAIYMDGGHPCDLLVAPSEKWDWADVCSMFFTHVTEDNFYWEKTGPVYSLKDSSAYPPGYPA